MRIAYTGLTKEPEAPLCLLDGHLDNTAELSAMLGSLVHNSPEELLAAAWLRWGHDLPQRLRGDFALVIWDETRGQGLLARDQLGVRSLFLHDFQGSLCFASEVRHLLALLPSRPAPDHVSLAHWITMSNRPGSSTLYTGIRRLNPGAALLLNGQSAREVQYWSPQFTEPLSQAESQLVERTRAELKRAVVRRISPVGLTGVLMSGGLDSSAVAALAVDQAPGRIYAQSAVFPDHPGVDESALISELNVTLGIPGIMAGVRAGGMLASALESIAEWQMPLISWGDFWALPLLRAAADAGVRTTLGGDGGDELFGARTYLVADRIRTGHPRQALDLVRELPGAGDHPARREVARIFARVGLAGALPYRVHDRFQRSSARRSLPAWLTAPVTQALISDDDPLAWKRLDGPRWWAESAHTLTRGIEESGIFEHQRRRAASAGLQARHPLFDLDLVDFCLSLPPLASFDRHRSRPIFRAAMRGMLPDSVRLRPQKALFDSLIIDSLSGSDGANVRELLCDPGAELRAYVDQRAMERALFETPELDPRTPFQRMWQVWRLATAEYWLRAQRGGDELERLAERTSRARLAFEPTTNQAAKSG